MTGTWRIKKYNGDTLIGEWSLPGGVHASRIEEIVQRLACKDLNEEEIINASLPRNYRTRTPFLDRVGQGNPVQIGDDPYFTVEYTLKENK